MFSSMFGAFTPTIDRYTDTAYTVTTGLFGASSGIPWWAWLVVITAMLWKLLLGADPAGEHSTEDHPGDKKGRKRDKS